MTFLLTAFICAALVASWPVERFWIFQTKQRLVRPWLHNLSVAALMVVISAIITSVTWLAMKVAYMYLSPVEQTSDTEVIAYSQDAPRSSGAIEAHTRINAIGCAQDGSDDGVDVVWDDAWFFGDPTVYNPDLAFASGVLAAFANSESTAYLLPHRHACHRRRRAAVWQHLLSRAFVMASGGIMFLVQGVLGCIKAACGMHGLSSGKYRKFIFASGVIACSTFFQALLGMFSLNVDSAAAVIMFQVACVALAWAEQAHPSAKKERAAADKAADDALEHASYIP